MSSAHDAHGASAHAHDDHDAFDGEPAKELSPGEPRSPAWLPAVGLAFFSCVAVYALAGGDPQGGNAPAPKAVEVHPQQHAVAPTPVPAPRPAAAPAGSVRRLSPDQIEAVRKRIEEARAKAQPGH
jgi:hypothetical protein